ncbi:unnamed protein product [Camellia sinensis]
MKLPSRRANTSSSQPTRIGHTFEEFPSMTGNTSASQASRSTSYGRGMSEPVGDGRVMSRSALRGNFITRGRREGGSAKVTTQRQTDKGKGKA